MRPVLFIRQVFVVGEEAEVGVVSTNPPGRPRTKVLSRNTKERRQLLVMTMNNVVTIPVPYHVYLRRTKHDNVKLLCTLERVVG